MIDAIVKALADLRVLLAILFTIFALLGIIGAVQTKWFSLTLDRRQRTALLALAVLLGLAFGVAITRQPAESAAGSSGPSTSSPGVLDAPEFAYQLIQTTIPLDECVRKAGEVLRQGGFTGIRGNTNVAYGYRGAYIGAIGCHDQAGQVLLLSVGKNLSKVRELKELLLRSY